MTTCITLKEIDKMGIAGLRCMCIQAALDIGGKELRSADHLRDIIQKLQWVLIEKYDPRETAERGLPPCQAEIWKRVDHGSFERPSYLTHPDWYSYGDSTEIALYRAFLKAWHEVTE